MTVTDYALPLRVITGSRAHWVKDANDQTVIAVLKSDPTEEKEESERIKQFVHAFNYHERLFDLLRRCEGIVISAVDDEPFSHRVQTLKDLQKLLAELEATKP